MLVGQESKDEHGGVGLPFGYVLERDDDLLILRRADGSEVVAFGAVRLDPFEVELAVWEDAV